MNGEHAAEASDGGGRSGGRSGRVPEPLVLALLALATAAAYEGVRRCGFVSLDDPHYVLRNGYVRSGLTLEGVRWAFTTTWLSNWHPLTWLSYMLDVTLFGVDSGAMHVVNLLLHVAAACALLLALAELTGSFARSALVAALFALHPLHVESVAWISERKDVLSGLFFSLVLLAYARYARRPSGRAMLVAAGWLALGLAAKPMLVTTPFVLLLVDAWPLRRPLVWRRVSEKAPLFALAAASSVVTFLAQRSGGAVASFGALPLAARLARVPVNYVAYLRKALWPSALAAHYPIGAGLPLGEAALCTLLLLGITGLAWRERRRRPYLLWGWLWYLGTLVPVIGLVQVGTQSLADRYTYIPLTGPFVAGVWLAADLLAERRLPRPAGAAAALALLLALGLTTHRQVRFWSDSITLFRRAVAVSSEDAFAHQGLGNALAEAGHREAALASMRRAQALAPGQPLIDEGEQHLRAAVDALPDYFDGWFNLGSLLARKGDLPGAIEAFGRAAAIDPSSAEALGNLGQLYLRVGRVDEGLAASRRAIARARASGNEALARRIEQVVAGAGGERR
jgi:tetratricopeptide (TPR) repeat protein